jgi:gentisate 1,2-dioxygenase
MPGDDRSGFESVLTMTESGLVAHGVVARQIATHRVEPLPGRDLRTCRMDRLGGHTMTAMHLAEVPPGGSKCNHRHLDETMAFIAAGRGYTELRQSDYTAPIRAQWQAGDVVVVPTNAWHRHVNTDPDQPMRQLSFRNLPLMNNLLHGPGRADNRKPAFNMGGRFPGRFDDESDYLTRRVDVAPGVVATNLVRGVADEAAPPPDGRHGEGVAVQRYEMGGQRTLRVELVLVPAGGRTADVGHLAEENVLVLRGEGHTLLSDASGSHHELPWAAGDLVCPPLGVRRQHVAGGADVRLLRVSNVALELALELDASQSALPDRLARFLGQA